MYSSGGVGVGGASFGYGTGDFTWEMWIFPTSTSWTTGNFTAPTLTPPIL